MYKDSRPNHFENELAMQSPKNTPVLLQLQGNNMVQQPLVLVAKRKKKQGKSNTELVIKLYEYKHVH